MDPSPLPDEPVTRIRVSEALDTGPSVPPPHGGGLEIAFYPDRIARPSTPPALSPSQALRFADDPERVAAAAETAGSRTTVTPPAPPRHPQAGESEPPPADVNRQVRDVPDGEPTAARPRPVVAPASSAAVEPEHQPTATDDGVAGQHALTAQAHAQRWSVRLDATAPPPARRPWWRRILRRSR